METGLARYDAMCRAIAEAHQIDEVKDIRDKAMALERYAQQAMNMDAERKACEIRLRAERRAGQILAEMKERGERAGPSNGGANIPMVSRNATPLQTLPDLGITRDQSSKWQKLARVSEDAFESALGDPTEKPSTIGIIRKASGDGGAMDSRALWLWGRLRDFEKDRIPDMEPEYLLGEMTQTMLADVKRIAPIAAAYLQTLSEAIEHVTYQ
jgi:hypothetical protein